MAESIILHFGSIEESILIDCLNESFDRHDDESVWLHPRNDYLVKIMPYEGLETEYEQEERDAILKKLGVPLSCSYEFEIRRSKSDQACDLLENFIRTKLFEFNFVVDDMFNCYSNAEIKEFDDFLDRYRYKKPE